MSQPRSGAGSRTNEVIRRAQPGDEAEITAMIRELAAFEKASDECTVTDSQLHTALVGPQGRDGRGGGQPIAHAHVVEVDGQLAATAVWFLNFSTWDGVAGIYLEDLFVRPAFRRRGLARKLLSALAGECEARGGTRLSWAVLNWNVNAIALYDAVGGKPQTEWTTYRVSGRELSALTAETAE
ncbi:MAG: N-acetyltransferase family protein [Microbacteriaceae bacterium]